MGIHDLIQFVLHFDVHLRELVEAYQTGVYGILFAIIFAETGLVVTPFLPGDSLLFACGALAADGRLSFTVLVLVLTTAAVFGNLVNYTIGRWVGLHVFTEDARFMKKRYLDQTRAYYERHGALTVIITRFVPIVRTFAPFVAGASGMNAAKFGLFNLVGGFLWVILMTGSGFLFGNIPVVRENFSLVALGIIAVSLVPIALEWIRARRRASEA